MDWFGTGIKPTIPNNSVTQSLANEFAECIVVINIAPFSQCSESSVFISPWRRLLLLLNKGSPNCDGVLLLFILRVSVGKSIWNCLSPKIIIENVNTVQVLGTLEIES